MTKLIVPTNELIIPSRRGFMLGVLTSAIAAPMIVRADSLMQINSLQNRLVWAFNHPNWMPFPQGVANTWMESGINARQAWDDDFINDWKRFNPGLNYQLRRAADITEFRNEVRKREIFNEFVLNHYDKYGDLYIPQPRKADIII